MRAKPLVFALAVAAALGTFALFYVWNLPVSRTRLSQLKMGMTTNQVVALLGRPQMETLGPQGDPEKVTMWLYESRLSPWAVDVFFNGSGRYTSHWKD